MAKASSHQFMNVGSRAIEVLEDYSDMARQHLAGSCEPHSVSHSLEQICPDLLFELQNLAIDRG